MILEIDENDSQMTVELRSAGGQRAVVLDGREVCCDWVRLPDGRYSIILDGQVFDLSVELDTDACHVTDGSGTHRLRVKDPRRLAAAQGFQQGQTGLQRICADMPGKVIRLLVEPGSQVAYDQGLLVLEAMKMQNEIRAPKAGVIREIAVTSGQAVSTGDFLISL